VDDTQKRVRAVLARHNVVDSALLESIRSLPPEDAARLARDLRECANDLGAPRGPRQVSIRPWSFLSQPDK